MRAPAASEHAQGGAGRWAPAPPRASGSQRASRAGTRSPPAASSASSSPASVS